MALHARGDGIPRTNPEAACSLRSGTFISVVVADLDAFDVPTVSGDEPRGGIHGAPSCVWQYHMKDSHLGVSSTCHIECAVPNLPRT